MSAGDRHRYRHHFRAANRESVTLATAVAMFIADLLDALQPPVLKRLLVIVLWFWAIQLAIMLILGQVLGYIAG